MKFLSRGASEYTPPPPSPGKCLLARNGGRGGGVYNFSLDSFLWSQKRAYAAAANRASSSLLVWTAAAWGGPTATSEPEDEQQEGGDICSKVCHSSSFAMMINAWQVHNLNPHWLKH